MLPTPDLLTRLPRPTRRARLRRRLVGVMLAVSLLVHLLVVALFLVSVPERQQQAMSPASIDIIADPTPAADRASETAPPSAAPTLGEPTAPDAPAPPADPVPAAPEPAAPPPPVAPPEPEPEPARPPEPAPPSAAPPAVAVPALPAPETEAAPPAPSVEATPPVPAPVAPQAELPTPAAPSRPTVNLGLPPPAAAPALDVPPPPPPVPPPPPAPPPRAPAFPRPIISSWNANPLAGGGGAPPRQPRGGGGIDLSLGPVARESRGAPPRGRQDTDASIRVVGANVGPDWLQLMQQWWVRHRYYPTQAAANNEDGTVQIQVSMDRFGKVHAVRIAGSSGSQWLDAGSLSIFRNAQLPPFPSGTQEDRAEVYLTLNYYLVRR